MLKKILIGFGVLVLLLVTFALSFFFYFTRLASPEAEINFTSENLHVDIKYCKPSKKDRLIFGSKESGAVVPFGQYWRLGANAATEITFNRDVIFKDKNISAGTYRMYAVVSENSWKVKLNSELGAWGAVEPDYSKDVLEIDVPVDSITPSLEQFTISTTEIEKGLNLSFAWDNRGITFPITVASE